MPAPEDPNHTQLFLEGRLRARGLALHIIAGGFDGGGFEGGGYEEESGKEARRMLAGKSRWWV